MRGSLRVCAILAGICTGVISLPAPANPDFQDSIWISSKGGLLRVSSADGSMVFEIGDALSISAIAIDSVRGTVVTWAGEESLLRSYGFNGALLLTETVTLPAGNCERDSGDEGHEKGDENTEDSGCSGGSLAVNDGDGSIWLACGRSVIHLNSTGTVLKSLAASRRVRSIALDPGQTKVWVATKATLTQYDSNFTALRTVALGENGSLRQIDVDAASGNVWAVLDSGVRRYSPVGAPLTATADRRRAHDFGR